jgi:peptidoglycan/LPS O-acetylase OafA/YrhL
VALDTVRRSVTFDNAPALTTLRAFAALLVFLHHFPPSDRTGLLATVGREGHVGVTVFFVLSGFLITARYREAFAAGRIGLSDYFRKRVARIVPLYWAVLGLSLALSPAGHGGWAGTLPEWLLLQGFFAPSVGHLAVPTSWTLTLEECFYAAAPLIFFTLRSRRPAWLVLAGWTVGLLALGGIALRTFEGTAFGFLSTPREVVIHTFFGRFVDFALGVGGALLFASGRVERLWAGRRGPLLAGAGALAAFGLLVLGEHGMATAGGIEGDRWAAAWSWNLVVAAASLLAILSLTCGTSPVSRAMALGPLVYLGRISYALYLIQMTPLGKGLMYRLLPSEHPLFLPLLYVGMSAVSAVLFEVVEEPGRRLVLRWWPSASEGGGKASPAAPHRLRAAFLALVLLVSIGYQAATWASGTLHRQYGQPSLQEVDRAVGEDPSAVITVQLPEAAGPVAAHRVPLPEEWLLGRGEDRRAPTSLLVYLEGRPVPFQRRAPDAPLDAGDGPLAYFKRPRAAVLDVHMPVAREAELAVVRNDAWTALSLQGARLRRTPAVLFPFAAVLLAALAVAWTQRRSRRFLEVAAFLGLLAAAVWIAGDVHHWGGSAYALALEMAVLLVLPAVRTRPLEARPDAR